jgi:hypothetical protein
MSAARPEAAGFQLAAHVQHFRNLAHRLVICACGFQLRSGNAGFSATVMVS